MKKLSIGFVLLLLVLAGCSSGSAEKNDEPLDGEALYKRACVVCHGTDLRGGSANELQDIGKDYSEEEIVEIINEGVETMPGNLLDEEEAKIMAKWLLEQ